MSDLPGFATLAEDPDPRLDLLALAIAAELRDGVDGAMALARLEALGTELAEAVAVCGDEPAAQLRACTDLLGAVHGFAGDEEDYDHPDNSMLDLVLERRRGLPILLSVVYVEVARRAGVPLAGVGLPGHFVVGHVGGPDVLLADPFAGGALLAQVQDPGVVRPWTSKEIAMRMLNNLVAAHRRRGDVGLGIRAAQLRLLLPADAALRETLEVELRGMQATLN